MPGGGGGADGCGPAKIPGREPLRRGASGVGESVTKGSGVRPEDAMEAAGPLGAGASEVMNGKASKPPDPLGAPLDGMNARCGGGVAEVGAGRGTGDSTESGAARASGWVMGSAPMKP